MRQIEHMTTTATLTDTRTFEEKLDLFAQVAVNVGLGLKPGQELVMTAAGDAAAGAAYYRASVKAGASLVTTLLTDDA